MIFGTIEAPACSGRITERWNAWGLGNDDAALERWEEDGFLAAMVSSGAPALDEGRLVHHDPASRVTVLLYGELHDVGDLARRLGGGPQPEVGSLLVEGYLRLGTELFRRLNGSFVLVIRDPARGRVWIARDHLGIESLYYRRTGEAVHFCSDLRPLKNVGGGTCLEPAVVLRYLLLNYNPGFETLYRGIEKLRPGHVLRIEAGGIRTERYWAPSFRETPVKSREEYREELRALIRDAVRIRLQPGCPAGAYLSGGMDSSSVVCLMTEELGSPIHTFSFRCAVKSFDEVVYARAVSRHCGARHHEVPYDADSAREIVELVPLLQEPMSDVGIEVATFLLAKKAAGLVGYVLTGDGGDELFAGHPVYAADKVAQRFEALPRLVREPLAGLLQRLPDSSKKKSATIKLRRFAYSVGFPSELHSNRWRIYYKPDELRRLLSADWQAVLDTADPLAPLRTIYAEADGRDHLSRSLYGDYQTVVDFYLRRMQLVRRLGFVGRYPLLDHRLVEYAARIPSDLKVTSDAATKFLLRDAMADVLPPEILARKDKLGNSVPLKNWLRQRSELRLLVEELLSPEVVRRRGILDPAQVQSLWQRHLQGWENNSHRLWALVVFELWCRSAIDARPA
ncbi:MAG TPA: asparagine synthase-related protein [Longimicrobiales bacterium]